MSATGKTARLLQLARYIVQLENELALRRAEFARLTHEPEQMVLPLDAPGDGTPDAVASGPFLARTTGLPVRVQSVLDLSPKPLTAGDIALQLGQPESIDTIRAVLSKLLARGTVERPGVGLYRSARGGHKSAAGEDD